MGIVVHNHAVQAEHAFTMINHALFVDGKRAATDCAGGAGVAFLFTFQAEETEGRWYRQASSERAQILAEGAFSEERETEQSTPEKYVGP